jgi:catechol 2,3-dioxygenase-like lactoylglutathione lyase family enzyme
MITSLHALVYVEDPEAARAFFRDVLGFPAIDTGGGWLIFKTGPSEFGVHPSSWEHHGHQGSTDQVFDVSLMCDDLEGTMRELAAKGAEFADEVVKQEWGSSARLKIPGSSRTLTIFEPSYDPPALAQ